MSDGATIIPFEKPTPQEPAIGGKARCIACGHEWEAVAPAGTIQLQCPSCLTMRGLFVYPIGAPIGETEWRCACDCNVFCILADANKAFKAIRCLRCGRPQEFG